MRASTDAGEGAQAYDLGSGPAGAKHPSREIRESGGHLDRTEIKPQTEHTPQTLIKNND